MKLQAKVMLVMIGAWLTICGMVIVYSKFIITQQYKDLEKVIIEHKIQDTQRAFDRMLYSLSLYTLSWAQWDDAYDFMKVKSEKFIQSNFVTAIYRSSELNFIMFFDTQGKLHYGRSYNIATNEVMPVPHALLDYINKNIPFVTHHTVASNKVGILQTKLGLIVMSSRPVTMSNGKIPLRGSILMGYYLDDTLFNTLSQIVGMKVKFIPSALASKDKQLSAAYVQLVAGASYSLIIVNRNIDYGLVLLKDIDGNPIGVIRIEIPRSVYQEGLSTAYHYITIILLSGIIIIFIMWYLLKILVLNRVINISKQVLKINKERQFDQKLVVSGHDELSNMIFSINCMLEMISNSQYELRYLALHDSLTKLPNRDYFYELLTQAIINAKQTGSMVAVMFLDMDKFKKVNDHYGHAVGDKLLQIATHRIRKALRKNDVLGRQSGDEFILFMQNVSDVDVVKHTAKRILQVTSEPFIIDTISINVSFSIGISLYPKDSVQVEELIKYADDVMYVAKIKGNNYRFYNDESEVESD
jgi:diguanylate cyclase (GGDEF)-like protein